MSIQHPSRRPLPFRFRPDDEEAITSTVRSTYALWSGGRPVGSFAFNRIDLRRRAAKAIGCTLADLRDVELEWIDNLIDQVSTPW